MGTTTKTVFKNFDYSRCDDFAAYLSRMAAKGWHFREWGFGLEFDRGEPQQVEYAVEVFTKASESAVLPQPKTREFSDYCKAAGWEFVDSQRKFCIFRKIDEQAVRIFTPEERITNVFRSIVTVSDVIGAVFMMLFLLLLLVGLGHVCMSYLFFKNILWATAVWSLWLVKIISVLLSAFWLRAKLKRKLRNGEEIYIGYQKNRKWFFRVQDLCTLLLLGSVGYFFVAICTTVKMVLVFLLLMVLIFLFSFWLHKVRPELKGNVVAKVIFVIFLAVLYNRMAYTTVTITEEYKRELMREFPIAPIDYGVSNGLVEFPEITKDETIFGSRNVYMYYRRDGMHAYKVSYTTYKSPFKKIVNSIWELELAAEIDDKTAVDCTKNWGAKEAVRTSDGDYYVRYENVIFVLIERDELVLTAEHIALIRDRFDLR